MTSTGLNPHAGASPLSSLENSHHHVPARLTLSRCTISAESGVPLFIEKCIQFIEEYGLSIEGLYRISGYKNQVELVISKLIEGKRIPSTKERGSNSSLISDDADPTADLHLLHVPASAVATALKDMMRKLDEPLLSSQVFDQCDLLTGKKFIFLMANTRPVSSSLAVDQLREQKFLPLQKALCRTSELKYRTIKVIFKHLHL